MASIVMTTARTGAVDPQTAAEELVRGLGAAPRLAVMFASSERDQRALNEAGQGPPAGDDAIDRGDGSVALIVDSGDCQPFAGSVRT